jgi:hypothetical protein
MRTRLSLLLIATLSLLSLPTVAAPAPPEVTLLNLERPLPASGEVGLANVVTLTAGEAIPAAPSSAGSVIGGFFSQFLTPQGIASVVVTVLGLVAGAMSLSALRKRQVAIATNGAFHLVEDFAATTETDIDDKIALGLQKANEWMVAQGWRPLKSGEVDSVKLGFTAINGAMKAAEKIQTAAIEASKQVPPTA